MTAVAIEKLATGPRQQRSDFGLGASEAAAAIGLSNYARPIDKWLEKTGKREPFAGNEKTFWGNVLEGPIRAHYVERNGVTVWVPPDSLYHRDHKWLRATPDGIVLDPATKQWLYVGPQVKNVGLRMAPAWQSEGGEHTTPIDYYVQGVVEMAVTDLPRIDFAVLLGGQEYFEVTLERDRGIEGDVLEQLAKFWALVESGQQPEIDDSESFRAHLLKQIKRRAHIEASPEHMVLIERWRDVAMMIKQMKGEESLIKNRLAAELAKADAHRMTSDLGDITVGAPRKKTAWKAIAEQLGKTLPTLAMVERELEALRADVIGDLESFGTEPANQHIAGGQALVQRIEALRAQLKLIGGSAYADIVKTNTKVGVPSLNRPRDWTKDIGDDDTNEET